MRLLEGMKPTQDARDAVKTWITDGHRGHVQIHPFTVGLKCGRQRTANGFVVFDQSAEQVHHNQTWMRKRG